MVKTNTKFTMLAMQAAISIYRGAVGRSLAEFVDLYVPLLSEAWYYVITFTWIIFLSINLKPVMLYLKTLILNCFQFHQWQEA